MNTVYIVLLVCVLPFADAWRDVGHMVTGEIAAMSLSDATRAKLLPALTAFNEFDLPTDLPFASDSAWADLLKYDKFQGFDAWHFYDAPYLYNGAKTAPQAPPTNALWTSGCVHGQSTPSFPTTHPPTPHQALALIKTTLLDPTIGSTFGQAFALRMALHIVGDIHQPLHAITRVTPQHPQGDMGGNLFKVKNYVGLGDLHSFWDFGAGALQYPTNMSRLDLYTPRGTTFIAGLAKNISAEYPPSKFGKAVYGNINFTQWQQESYDVAVKSVYTNFTDTEDWSTPHPVPAAYQAEAMKIVKERVALGGYRLAAFLESVYGNRGPIKLPVATPPQDEPNLYFYVAAGVAGLLFVILVAVLVINKKKMDALRDEQRRGLISGEGHHYA